VVVVGWDGAPKIRQPDGPHPKEDRFEGGSVNYEPERWRPTHAKTP